jgi:outer membrane protein TolC
MRLGFKFLHILPLSAVLLSACSLPPRTSDDTAQAAQQLDEVPIWSRADNAAPTAYLNQLLHSESLDALLKEALTANPSLQQTLLTLQRRPDLQAAYLAIEAANLRISVAYKNLLPRIDIQAALTPMIDSPHTAVFTDPVWSLLAQLTAPL